MIHLTIIVKNYVQNADINFTAKDHFQFSTLIHVGDLYFVRLLIGSKIDC